MKQEDFEAYERAKKVLVEIKKAEAQLSVIGQCDCVQISNNGNRSLRFDINEQHPFYDKAIDFIKSYNQYLIERKDKLQKEFDAL